MNDKHVKKPIAIAVSAALAATFGAVGVAQADNAGSPFQMNSLSSGYETSGGEGSCGEGKCGASGDKGGEGSCGGDKGGEGSCGGDKGGEGSCGEGKCGGSV